MELVLLRKGRLRNKRFRLVSETEERTGFSVLAGREMKQEPKNESGALLLTPFFARSLTLVPCSLLLHRTETLATQAKGRVANVS